MNFSIFRIMKRGLILYFFVFILLFGLTIDRFYFSIDSLYYNSSNITVHPILYDTEFVYNDSVLYGKKRVIREGIDGYALATGEVLIEPVSEVVEIGSGYLSVSYGSTTGYGADCVGCTGFVACPTPSGATHNLIRDGIYYHDLTYGDVRIIAADNSLFPCGTIIFVDNGIIEPFRAIVMDTGSAMRNAWRNYNQILIDIAFSYENSTGIYDATNRNGNVKLEVYRTGW